MEKNNTSGYIPPAKQLPKHETFWKKTEENTTFLYYKKWCWDNRRVRKVLSDLSINAALCLMVEMVEKRVVLSPEKCPCTEISLLVMTPDWIVITFLFIIVLTITNKTWKPVNCRRRKHRVTECGNQLGSMKTWLRFDLVLGDQVEHITL